MASDSPAPPADPHETLTGLYDAIREARMNVMYYGRRLELLQRWNLGIEIAIALGTSGTLFSLPFFASPVGKAFAITLGAAAAILGVLKPVLSLPERIERLSKLWSGYQGAFLSGQRLARHIKAAGTVTVGHVEEVESIHERMDAVCGNDDPCPNQKKLAAFQDAVNTEMPFDHLWYPAT